uniref:Serine protease nudel n=1 Tax=Culex pipiens TaxID=7175 RepID=A0A8D8IZ47_CULPI
MKQSFGIWHSKCFPKDVKYDDQTIKEICDSIGYHRIAKVYGRKMLHESRLRTVNSTDNPVDRLRKAATKAVVLNKFSKVLINEKQSYFMKPSRPMFKLVNWDEHDEHNCDRLETRTTAKHPIRKHNQETHSGSQHGLHKGETQNAE